MADVSEKALRTEGLSWTERFVRRFKSSSSGPEYHGLVSDDEESSLHSGGDHTGAEPPKKKWSILGGLTLLRYPLYISIIIHGIILADLIYAHWRSPLGTYNKGFKTDWGMPCCC
jgi:hypothetical protein